MDGCRKTNVGPETVDALENKQFSENRVDLTSCELFEALGDRNELDLGIDAQDFLPEFGDPDGTQTNGKYNLRKSLAWDTAFFTSAGVLDAEELSKMITGTGKGENHFLPIIHEDMTASTESFSSFENDTLNMESMEDDLFVDVRASIQRSSRKMPNLTHSNDKEAAVEVDNVSVSSLKNEDIASGSPNKNPKAGSTTTTVLQTGRSSKSLPKQNVEKQGLRKAIKQDLGRSQMVSTTKLGGKNSLLNKSSKPITNPTSTTAKREATGLDKTANGNSKSGASGSTPIRGTQSPKVSVLPRKLLPKTAVPSKSALYSSSTSTGQSTRSSTYSDSSSSLSSGATSKSLMARRNPCRSSNTIACPPGSIPKGSSRIVLNKKPLSTLSPRLAATEVSSSVSSAGSISDWTSISSSSSRRQSSSRTSQDTSSRSTDGRGSFLHPRNPSTDRTSSVRKSQEANLAGNISRKTSATGMTQASAKPSGLRMPSPKIGFFDGAKSSPRTPNVHKQSPSGLRPLLPKNGAAGISPCLTPNSKLKSTKSSKAITVTSSAIRKCDSPAVTSANSSVDASSSSSSQLKLSASTSHGAEADASIEECRKLEEVHSDSVKQEVITGTGALEVKDSAGLSKRAKADGTREECRKTDEVHVDVGVKQEVIAGTGASVVKDSASLSNGAKAYEIREECQKAKEVHVHVVGKLEVVAGTGSASLSNGAKAEATREECRKAEEVHVDVGVKQGVTIDNGNPSDLSGIKTSVERHIVTGLGCSNEMDLVASQNGRKDDYYRTWEATSKENEHREYQGEGFTEHNGDMNKNVWSSEASMIPFCSQEPVLE